MRKNRIRWIKRFKVWHKWPAIIIAFLAFLFSLSGIVLNHRSLFSCIDVTRKILPSNYTYNNWNLDAVKGSLVYSSDSIFIYGKAGVYLANKKFSIFNDFNQGFKSGIDNRSITAMEETNKCGLIAGTLNGLYQYNIEDNWIFIPMPVSNQRITDITTKSDTLIILTRDYLLKSFDLKSFDVVELPSPPNYKKQTSWFKFLWNLHSGELFGLIGKLFVDLLGLVVLVLSVTGLIRFFYPKLFKERKQESKITSRTFKKTNLNWHNKIGYAFVLFLAANAITGMFLRPPLLIAIANAKIGIIPFTDLDNTNSWQDKLRKIRWNEYEEKYIISTSEGFYFSNESLSLITTPNIIQPPVSVMGCNVLHQVAQDEYLVGSFSGLFSWNLTKGIVYDVGKASPYNGVVSTGRPISDHMVSGLVYIDNAYMWYSDYNKGMVPVTNKLQFNEMPELIKKAPISLWNLSLEVHTGRIFESILGPFYILYVPLSGICMLVVLISGFFLWYWVYKGKPKKKVVD